MSNASIEFKVKKLLHVALGNASICCEVNEYYAWLSSPSHGAMQLDIYLPDYGVALEIDGKQHYKYPNAYHESYQEFHDQRGRDRLKEQLCDDKGIALIRIRGKLLYCLFLYFDNDLLVASVSRDLAGKLQHVSAHNDTLVVRRNRKIILDWVFSLESKYEYISKMRLASD